MDTISTGRVTPDDEKSTVEYPGWPGQEDWRAVQADLADKDNNDDAQMETDESDEETDKETDDQELEEGLDMAYRHMLEEFSNGDNPPWPPAGEEPKIAYCAPLWQEDVV